MTSSFGLNKKFILLFLLRSKEYNAQASCSYTCSYIDETLDLQQTNELHHEKTCLRGLRPGKTQNWPVMLQEFLKSWNFGYTGTDIALADLLFAYSIRQVFSWHGSFAMNGHSWQFTDLVVGVAKRQCLNFILVLTFQQCLRDWRTISAIMFLFQTSLTPAIFVSNRHFRKKWASGKPSSQTSGYGLNTVNFLFGSGASCSNAIYLFIYL